jgi:YVTN family beta-propeller protein
MPEAAQIPDHFGDTSSTPRIRVDDGGPSKAQRGAVAVLIGLILVLVAVVAVAISRPGTHADPSTSAATPGAATGLLPSGRQLTPAGVQVVLGNFPTGGAVTADGRFLWTVSAGFSSNDVRIVDTAQHRVCQTLSLPGASGGIALDSAHRLAYVSGLANSRWQPSKDSLRGAKGNDILVYTWTATCGQARLVRVIPLPPQPGAPTVQAFPPPRAGLAGAVSSWPQKLAVSPDGARLLVPLNLANSAAVIDLNGSDRLRYVPTGSYPFGGAIVPGGKIGLVTNEAAGTLSVVDLQRGVKLTDITVGPPLSHPQGVVVDAAGARAYVAVSASDQVVVVDVKKRAVERTISVGRPVGLGTMPVALALDPAGDRLFVAESGAEEIAAIRLPGGSTVPALDWTVVGRIPTADQPQAVVTVAAQNQRPAQLMYVAAEGVGVGPNPRGTNPVLPSDPIFRAFNPIAPKVDIFNGEQYPPALVTGRGGLMPIPTDTQIARLTPVASRQLQPTDTQPAPADTPLRAGGLIRHVFFVVRENRSYDQMLGDDARGNGDPKLTVFGKNVTPNMHALVSRFPLLDNVYANSEASIQGHYWTASASVPDYVTRNWVQQYGSRGRPNDFGMYAVTWPGNGFLFNRAERQRISYFNYGEGFIGGSSSLPDRDRTPAQLADLKRVEANSDLGPPTAGCYPSSLTIGQALDGNLKDPLTGQIFDSTLPAGAPKGSHSHMDCFRKRFASQLAANAVPAFSYLTMTSDHTRGTQPGFPTPNAMIADSDQALGQLVETISRSSIWSSSAIFVVEDDSQDGADHVNAHRIPALVISPYARAGAVIHRRYDLPSVVRSIELILGMKPLNLNDALATPMYDAFTARALNTAPVTAIRARINLLTRNGPAAPDSMWSSTLALGQPDQVPQWQLDQILWHSAHGPNSKPPPPGPAAEGEGRGHDADD